MRDFNGESNFNNFVATNDERRFFTRHRYPVSFFYREELLCLLGKREKMSCSQKNCIQQSTLFSHQARGKDYVKVY